MECLWNVYKESTGNRFIFNDIIIIIIIIIIVSIITVFTGVLFVHQPGANHAPGASVTQVNHLLLLLLLLLFYVWPL